MSVPEAKRDVPRSAASNKLHGVLRQRAVFDVGRDRRVAPLGDPQGAAGYDILLETGAADQRHEDIGPQRVLYSRSG